MKQERVWSFRIVLVDDYGYGKRRCFPTVKGATEYWAEDVTDNIMHKIKRRYKVHADYNKKRLEVRRKAIRRAQPIFERVMNPK